MSNTQVNFDFISALEGRRVCRAYVPEPEHSRSGVTIATGFDIGQRSVAELNAMLPARLAAKLALYSGLTRLAAVKALQAAPLVISDDEAKVIDAAVKTQLLSTLQQRYNRASAVGFDKLNEQQQTVIASVAFQYGDLARRCPKFWQAATTQDWKQLGIELRDFGDCYHSRRNKEANYLDLAQMRA